MSKERNNYWSETEEQLIIQYNGSASNGERNKIANLLYPKLVIMGEGLLLHYFGRGVKANQKKDPDFIFNKVNDVVAKVFFVINKFKPEQGTAFAFCGTVIKNELNDYFKKSAKLESKFLVTDITDDLTPELSNGYEMNDGEYVDLLADVLKKLDGIKYNAITSTGATLTTAILRYLRITPPEFINKYSMSVFLHQCYLKNEGYELKHYQTFFQTVNIVLPIVRKNYLTRAFGANLFNKDKAEIDIICLNYVHQKTEKTRRPEKNYYVEKPKSFSMFN